jgi:hypothetical protein
MSEQVLAKDPTCLQMVPILVINSMMSEQVLAKDPTCLQMVPILVINSMMSEQVLAKDPHQACSIRKVMLMFNFPSTSCNYPKNHLPQITQHLKKET